MDESGRIRQLERRCAQLSFGVRGSLALWALTLVALVAMGVRGPGAPREDEVLRVRGLEVVDANGVARVILGAPVPEPRILGRRHPRGGDVSGVILQDGEGNERGGYVTDDSYGNAMLTLDSVGRMQFITLVEPDGAVWCNLSAPKGNQFDVRVSEGGTSLKVQDQGEVTLAVPK